MIIISTGFTIEPSMLEIIKVKEKHYSAKLWTLIWGTAAFEAQRGHSSPLLDRDRSADDLLFIGPLLSVLPKFCSHLSSDSDLYDSARSMSYLSQVYFTQQRRNTWIGNLLLLILLISFFTLLYILLNAHLWYTQNLVYCIHPTGKATALLPAYQLKKPLKDQINKS